MLVLVDESLLSACYIFKCCDFVGHELILTIEEWNRFLEHLYRDLAALLAHTLRGCQVLLGYDGVEQALPFISMKLFVAFFHLLLDHLHAIVWTASSDLAASASEIVGEVCD